MTGKLPKKPLGQSGIEISRLGLGTVKFGRNQGVKYPEGFELPDDEACTALLSQAQELGINMLDTAPAYGTSEERLGTLLQHTRKDWVIVGKVGEEFENGESEYIFTADHFKYSLERSLKRLQTDMIDVLLIHSNGNDMAILDDDSLIRVMHDLKDQGLVKAIGASTKTVEGGIASLERLGTVMACYNPVYQDERAVLDYAAQNGGGVLLKKALASGHIDTLGGDDPVEHAMQFAFDHAGTDSIILGTINPKHLEQNVKACLKAIGNK